MTLGTYWTMRSGLVTASLDEARTASTFVLAGTAFWVLYRLIRPIDPLDAGLLVGFIAAFAAAITIPWTREFYALDWPSPAGVATLTAILVVSIAVLEIVLRRSHLLPLDWLDRLAGDSNQLSFLAGNDQPATGN